MPSTSDLRELLNSDAEHLRPASFPVEQVIGCARHQRRRRRILALTGGCVVAAGAVALPLALVPTAGTVEQPGPGRTLGPATATPVIPPDGGWVPDLPGLDLPLGDPLTTAYASGSTLTAGGRTLDVGAQILQILDVPEGVVVLTAEADAGTQAARLELVADDGSTALIDAGLIANVRALTDPAGVTPTRIVWLWLNADQDSESELRSVDLDVAEPTSSAPGRFNLVLGFQDGAVLASTIENERAVPDLARWEPGTDLVQPVASDPGDGSFLLGVTGADRNTDRALMYTGEVPQCNYAAPLTNLGERLWEQCEGGPLVPARTGALAANQAGVVDVATGAFVARFDLRTDNLLRWDQGWPDTGTAVQVAGWSGDDVLIRLSSTDGIATTPAPGGGFTYNPAYVGVRCSASTGACERLPHPIDAIDDGSL